MTLSPSRGQLTLFGRAAATPNFALRRRIGYMPQTLHLPDRLKVLDFLAYMAWLRAIPRSRRADEIKRVLRDADLAEVSGRRVGQLSGGMHRRLLLAQALLGQPELLLLDEPTAGLDPEQRLRLRELIRALDWTRTVVVSSHVMGDLMPMSNRLLMLDRGHKAFDGTRSEFIRLGEAAATPGNGISAHEAAFMALRSAGDRT